MRKPKTNRSAAKRFKVTGTGKIVRRPQSCPPHSDQEAAQAGAEAVVFRSGEQGRHAARQEDVEHLERCRAAPVPMHRERGSPYFGANRCRE